MSSDWEKGTRRLHLGLAVTVTLQLFISLVMQARVRPGHPAVAFARFAFQAHRWLGMVAVAVVAAHWVYSLQTPGAGGWRHLFPWSPKTRPVIGQELRDLVRLRMPAGGPGGGIAGLVHGLGLLAVTVMAVSGVVLFFGFSGTGHLAPLPHRAAEIHSLMANFVWAYWYGHVGLAVLHEWGDHPVLRSMFRW